MQTGKCNGHSASNIAAAAEVQPSSPTACTWEHQHVCGQRPACMAQPTQQAPTSNDHATKIEPSCRPSSTEQEMWRVLSQDRQGSPGWNERKLRTLVSGNQELIHRLRRERVLGGDAGHNGCVNTVSFTPSGETLISGSDDLRLIMWDWQRGEYPLPQCYVLGFFATWHGGMPHCKCIYMCWAACTRASLQGLQA